MSTKNAREQYMSCYRFMRELKQGRIPGMIPDVSGRPIVWQHAVDSWFGNQIEFGGWMNWWRYDNFDYRRRHDYQYSDIPF